MEKRFQFRVFGFQFNAFFSFNTFPLDVENHEVDILSPDTDSLVMVTLTLRNGEQKWVSKGASPDTLEAVIQAFTKGLAIAMKGTHA